MIGWEDAKRLCAMGLLYTETYKCLVISKWMSIASQNAEKMNMKLQIGCGWSLHPDVLPLNSIPAQTDARRHAQKTICMMDTCMQFFFPP